MDSPEAKSPSSPSRGDVEYDLDTDRQLFSHRPRVEKQLAEVKGALEEISLDENLDENWSDDDYDSMEEYLEDLIGFYSYYKEYLDDVYWTHNKMRDEEPEEPLFEYEIGKLKKKTPTDRCLKPTALNEEERKNLKKGDKVIKMKGKGASQGKTTYTVTLREKTTF